mgnify:CR=1 FL=1
MKTPVANSGMAAALALCGDPAAFAQLASCSARVLAQRAQFRATNGAFLVTALRGCQSQGTSRRSGACGRVPMRFLTVTQRSRRPSRTTSTPATTSPTDATPSGAENAAAEPAALPAPKCETRGRPRKDGKSQAKPIAEKKAKAAKDKGA